MSTGIANVGYRGKTGKHLLVLSFSQLTNSSNTQQRSPGGTTNVLPTNMLGVASELVLARMSAEAKEIESFISSSTCSLRHEREGPHRAAGGYLIRGKALGDVAAQPRCDAHVLLALVGVGDRG